MKKHKLGIIGVVLVMVLGFIFLNMDAKAEELTQEQIKAYLDEKSKTCNAGDLYDKYKPRLVRWCSKYDETTKTYSDKECANFPTDENLYGLGQYNFKIVFDGKASDLKDAKFKVVASTAVNPYTAIIDASSGKNGTNIGYLLRDADGLYSVTIGLVSSTDGCLGVNDSRYSTITDEEYKYKGAFTVELTNEKQGTEKKGNITLNTYPIIDPDSFVPGTGADPETNKVTISNSDFNKNFNEIVSHVPNDATHKRNLGAGKKLTDTDTAELYCRANLSAEDIDNISKYQNDPTTGKYYLDQNKDYYYAKSTEDVPYSLEYEYNYAPGNVVRSQANGTCTRTCEEALKVEYGPPVSSKAGLCFEYKVKVTSYVKCESVATYEKPKITEEYCNPYPICSNGSPTYIHQAGPKEEFDSCIQTCDGGKYSQKCSKKCYEKVYGTNTTNLPLNFNNQTFVTNMAQAYVYTSGELDECLRYNPNGCYVHVGDTIRWVNGPDQSSRGVYANYGRWYQDTGYAVGNNGNKVYIPDSGGFKRRDYGNGYECQDVCSWEGCSGDQYLNPGQIDADLKINTEKYNAAVTSCKAAASCTETTTEYAIAVKYDTKDKNDNTVVNKIYFPYSKSPTSEKLNSKKSDYTDNDDNGKKIVIDFAGCYRGNDANRWYMTEWSFPGTWIHNKTGDITYKIEGSDDGWEKQEKQFCSPLNAQNVNSAWWNCYEIYKASNKTASDVQTLNQCYNDIGVVINSSDPTKKIATYARFDDSTSTSNGYNIQAQTKDFGYFGWNLKINCFYALNSTTPPDGGPGDDPACDPKKECCEPPCFGDEGYEVRSVDLEDLFPGEGRKIGFNWTSAATLPANKNEAYAMNPAKLLEVIESRKDEIYDEDKENMYLDYRFVLTPKDLRNIRADNKTQKYTSYNGTFKVINGVNVYSSDLFRESGAIITAQKKAVLGYNNTVGTANSYESTEK